MLKQFRLRWQQVEFRRTFLAIGVIYAIAHIIEFVARSPVIGFFGGLVSLGALLLFGVLIYRDRIALRAGTIKTFWLFVGIFVLMALFGSDLLSLFFTDTKWTLITLYSANVFFWGWYLNFWIQNNSLPGRAAACVSAVCLYMSIFSVGLVALILFQFAVLGV